MEGLLFILKYLTVKNTVNCDDLLCNVCFYTSHSFEFMDLVRNKNIMLEHLSLKNSNNSNFVLSQSYRGVVQNLYAFECIFRTNYAGTDLLKTFLPVIEYYKYQLSLKQLNIAQCLYFNANIDYFFKYYLHNRPLTTGTLTPYFQCFARNMELLEYCQFVSNSDIPVKFPDCRVFLNSNTSVIKMNKLFTLLIEGRIKHESYDLSQYLNKQTIYSVPHSHVVTDLNYTNCLIAGTGLLIGITCVYYACK